MNILLTKFIYPIQKEIIISKKLKFSFDNPRTKKEIEIIKAHLNKSLNSPDEVYQFDHQFRLPIYKRKKTEDILTIEDSLNHFNRKYSEKDNYLKFFFNSNKSSDPIELLAKMWIVLRYDDEGEIESLKNYKRQMESENQQGGLILLNNNNPIITNSEKIINYTYLLSLLINTDNEFYNGQSFILNHSAFDLQIPKLDKLLNLCIFSFCIFAYSTYNIDDSEKWKSFFHINNKIIEISNKLEDIINDDNQDKILFIANQLKVIGHDIKDEKLKLVSLVSILEVMLTHSPDYRRFNVEESISKQFRLKASILIYQNNKKREINKIKERLKEIYNQRSNIAHGNFKSFTKYIEKEIKKINDEDVDETVILEKLNGDLFNFIRAIIEEYIKDRKFVDFLKEN